MSKDLSHNKVSIWLNNLKMHWQNKNVNGAMNLFTKCTSYQESPFLQRANTDEEIRKLWKEILKQSDIDITFQILSVCGKTATVNYNLHYKEGDNIYHSNGIYFIVFNDEGYCISFSQWFMSEMEV